MIKNTGAEKRKFRRLPCNGGLPGHIIYRPANKTLSVQSQDVSRFGLGVLSPDDSPLGAGYEFHSGGKVIPMRAVAKNRDTTTHSSFRLGLMTDDESVDLESLFLQSGHAATVTAEVHIPVAAETKSKYKASMPLVAEAGTFGTLHKYPLVVENVSRAGIMIVNTEGVEIPFRVNTILELVIGRLGKILSVPVRCIGKVLRLSHETDTKGVAPSHIVIALVELDAAQTLHWNQLVDELERDELAA